MISIELLQLPMELYKSTPSGSHSYTFILVMIALFLRDGAKCPNGSLGSLKSSFIFLCVCTLEYTAKPESDCGCEWSENSQIVKSLHLFSHIFA